MNTVKFVKNVPIFTHFPSTKSERIIGTEEELMVPEDAQDVVNSFPSLPLLLTNGGFAYEDTYHPESASPETRDPLQATVYWEACRRQLYEEIRGFKQVYNASNDWNGGTRGSHENYMTTAPRTSWHKIIPWLVVRNIFCGSGWFSNETVNGLPTFHLSQRAYHIREYVGDQTTEKRPILHLKHEPLTSFYCYDRMHLICGDALMSKPAKFMQLSTSIMIELIERDLFPKIDYDLTKAVNDLQTIDRRQKDWIMYGTSVPWRALDYLSECVGCAKKAFGGRDLVTDVALDIIQDTLLKLERIEKEPTLLFGRLDWVTKLELIRQFTEKYKTTDPYHIRSLDIEYHNLDPEKGLFYLLEKSGGTERLFTEEMLSHAINNPPENTRAHLRGNIVKVANILHIPQKILLHYLPPNEKIWTYLGGFRMEDPLDPQKITNRKICEKLCVLMNQFKKDLTI